MMSTDSAIRRFNKIFGVKNPPRTFGYAPRRKELDDDDRARLDAEMDPDAPFDTGAEDLTPFSPHDVATDAPPSEASSPSSAAATHISDVADLIIESSKGALDRGDVLRWLLFTTRGRIFAARARARAAHKRALPRKEQPMTRSELFSNFVKRHGAVGIAKSVNQDGAFLSEMEFTKLINEDCERTGRDFAKVFCADTEEGRELRKAAARCRDDAFAKAGAGSLTPIMPTVTVESDIDNPKSALAQLKAMAEKMKATVDGATLTAEQCFAHVYTDPKNAALAARERAEARSRLPTVGGCFAG